MPISSTCILAEVIKGGGDTARYTVLDIGLPPEIPGVAVNRQCASGMTAVDLAAASIAAGMEKAVIAGGVESMTQTPVVFRKSPDRYGVPAQWVPPGHPEPGTGMTPMGVLVGENTAEQYGISREEQDAWALQLNQRAVAAIDGGRFADEIVALNVARAGGEPVWFDTDEQPRRDTTADKLASLRPAFKRDGGAVGLGHPIGASGARILVTLIHELRRRGGGLGIASLCAGGGMGAATVLEVLPA